MFLAAENGALPGGKVGGVGDVARELPAALCAEGWQTSVLTPSYGMFARLPGACKLASVQVPFRGVSESVAVHEVPGSVDRARNLVFEHALFAPFGPGKIYCHDEDDRPFATDASKFALFGSAAAAYIDQLAETPDVVHLHDWPAALYLLLKNFSADYRRLRDIRTVFTIHNLAYQGTRPIDGDDSSLNAWFPQLEYDPELVRDPEHAQCLNPMALAIRSADCVSTVSPTYAREICSPSDPTRGFVGGEGLDSDLAAIAARDGLVGILNGCEYPQPVGRRPGWQRIVTLAKAQAAAWQQSVTSNRAHALAAARLNALPSRRRQHLLVSIGRLVQQKVRLFLEPMTDGRPALEHILGALGSKGVLFFVGSGEADLERRLLDIAERYANLVFLCGYSETLADPLYRGGDLFLMPSSFEPCGISQMLAMRSAQPCVVHEVGGLADTVEDGVTGFVFDGVGPTEQAAAFVATTRRALHLRTANSAQWQEICRRAAAQRFDWKTSARQTIDSVYDDARN
ncbi:MAG: glycogen/starch synthase [Gammaproteobacteria bacterium]|nr:glycogen/starch synthase [Gammaproteobacteria bacterium]